MKLLPTQKKNVQYDYYLGMCVLYLHMKFILQLFMCARTGKVFVRTITVNINDLANLIHNKNILFTVFFSLSLYKKNYYYTNFYTRIFYKCEFTRL